MSSLHDRLLDHLQASVLCEVIQACIKFLLTQACLASNHFGTYEVACLSSIEIY